MAGKPSQPSPDDRALRGLEPIQAAPVLEARTRSARREEVCVVLGRQDKVPPPKVVEALCQGFGWDTWSTLRRLEAPTPRIVRHEPSEESAMYWVGWLRELGIAAYAVPESRLTDARMHEAVTLTREGDALSVAASDGTLHRVTSEETLCIAGAELRIRTVRSVQSEGRIVREVVRDELEGVFDVHLRPGDTILRFRQSVLRYSEFLEGADTGSMALFERVKSLVREALPAARFYTDFEAAGGSLGESRCILSKSRDARPVPGGRQALSEVEVSEENELPLFQLWSLLLRFQHAAR